MSYSTDLKTYLTAIETKRQCCRDAYECGVNLRPYESVCAQDTGAWLRGAFVACGTMSDRQSNITSASAQKVKHWH